MGEERVRGGRGTTSTADKPDAGLLRPCRPDDDGPAALDPSVARLHHRLRVDLVDRLLAAVPGGWEVSAGCCWQPGSTENALRPDVVVHRTLTRDGRLPGPPVLCVDLAAGPADPRRARSYARLEVDHHWHLDSLRGSLQVSVRLDDVYRHCETLAAETLVAGADPGGPAWIDFGVGVAHLDGLLTVAAAGDVKRHQRVELTARSLPQQPGPSSRGDFLC